MADAPRPLNFGMTAACKKGRGRKGKERDAKRDRGCVQHEFGSRKKKMHFIFLRQETE